MARKCESCGRPAKYLADLVWTVHPAPLCLEHFLAERDKGMVVQSQTVKPPAAK